MLEQTVEGLKVPKYMNLPWLTKEYIKKNGWYPVPDEWLRDYPYFFRFAETCFGLIPWESRDEFKPGDIIIFHEFDEWEDEEGYNTDRFCIVEEEIEQYQKRKRDLLPVGVVVHPPSNQLNLFN